MKKHVIRSLAITLFVFVIYFFVYTPILCICNIPDSITVLSSEVSDGRISLCSGMVTGTVSQQLPVSTHSRYNPTATLKLYNLIPIKKLDINVLQDDEVYLGGNAVGFSMNIDGAIVVEKSPSQSAQIYSGDIIKSIDGVTIKSRSDISDALSDYTEGAVVLGLIRNNKEINIDVIPIRDEVTDTYKLGVWIKDHISGIGTLTYVRRDGRFGAVGHPISDSDTKSVIDISHGRLYKCSVLGITKGSKGVPGEIRAVYAEGKNEQGNVDKNNKYGVFGDLEAKNSVLSNSRAIKVGGRKTVRPGRAYICSALGDNVVDEYEIEIIKTNYQNYRNDKSLVFRVVDSRLLNKTGGIVQGMSGSPIVQDGKLIGAVTHVFVNDPTKGFGVYIDWMLGE